MSSAKISPSDLAQLIIPAVVWRSPHGFDNEKERIEEYLRMGVGGFLLIGGTQEKVRELTKWAQRESRHPLLIAADMERGAGQQFSGSTGLPPLAAIAALDDIEALKRAARLTAREARTMGVNWNLAPVCDLNNEIENPVLGTRTIDSEPNRVGRLAAAWIEACQSEGVLACAKHFPGHGRTTLDSHLTQPTVNSPLDILKEQDVLPFRSAIAAGVASIMTAHVSFPSLDPSGLPSTLSREMLQWLLRQQMKFGNLIAADALIMRGVLEGRDETEAAVLAIQAGCDVLLQPDDVSAVVQALGNAVDEGRLDPEVVNRALRRRLKWAQWASPPNDWRRPSSADTAWGALLADRCVIQKGPELPALASVTELAVIDDDLHVPGNHSPREIFAESLRERGIDVRRTDEPTAISHGPYLIAVFGDRMPIKGRAWLSDTTVDRIRSLILSASRVDRSVIVCAFGDPRLIDALHLDVPVVYAWSGDPVMQKAASRTLTKSK